MNTNAVIPAEAVAALAGVEQLQAIIRGELPAPAMGKTLNFKLKEVETGRAVFEGEPQDNALNPLGTVHGGWAATILDSALGCAVHSTTEAGERYTTLELKVNLTRSLAPNAGVCRCEGVIVHRGRRTATAEARLYNPAGKIVAHASTTCMIFPAGE